MNPSAIILPVSQSNHSSSDLKNIIKDRLVKGVKHKETGYRITAANASLGRLVKGVDEVKVAVLSQIDRVLEESVWLRADHPRPQKQKQIEQGFEYHSLAVPVKYNEGEYVAFMQVRKSHQGRSLYNVNTLEVVSLTEDQSGLGEIPSAKDLREARSKVISDRLSVNKDLANPDVVFSIGDTKMKDTLITDITKRIKDPEVRAMIMRKMADKMTTLKRDHKKTITAFGKEFTQDEIADPRKMKSLRKEAAMREALMREELENEIYADYGYILDQEELTKLRSQPLHEFIGNPKSHLHGDLMSRSAAIKAGKYDPKKHGDYDGAGGVSRSMFGGQQMPDQMAEELYREGLIKSPDVDVMWEALLIEQESVSNRKDELRKGKEAMRDARKQAKAESKEWLDAEVKKQNKDNSPMERAKRALISLDAVVMALPSELRGKVGGHTQLLKIKSDEKRLEYIQKKIEKADAVIEKWIVEETNKQIDKLFKRATPKKTAKGVLKATLPAEFTDRVMGIDDLSKLSKDEVENRIEKLNDEIDESTDQAVTDAFTKELVDLMAFGNMAGMDSDAITSFYENLASVVMTGKTIKEFKDEAHKAEMDRLNIDD